MTGQEDNVVDTESEEDVPETETEPRRKVNINPVALVIGLLYATLGAGALADQAWGGVDLSAIAGVGAVVAGAAVIIALLRR